jgi:hypothetical protein
MQSVEAISHAANSNGCCLLVGAIEPGLRRVFARRGRESEMGNVTD